MADNKFPDDDGPRENWSWRKFKPLLAKAPRVMGCLYKGDIGALLEGARSLVRVYLLIQAWLMAVRLGI